MGRVYYDTRCDVLIFSALNDDKLQLTINTVLIFGKGKIMSKKNENPVATDSDTVIVLDNPVKRDPLTLLPVYPDDPRYAFLPEVRYNQRRKSNEKEDK